jgi:predicted DsbA family dithiol-disulfide isomerase
MIIEIWSDIICPFCYIGKRRFEKALEKFEGKSNVQVTWKSYQLDPGLITNASKNVNQYLAQRKGISVEKAKEMNAYVTEMARSEGLIYNFDKAIVASSFDAHRLSHLAKRHGLQDAMEERLFAAYFTEGKNMADPAVLISLGKETGLDETGISKMLESDLYADEVHNDIYEAQQIGVRGVPFFVFDNKYAVSGAQDSEVFLDVMNKVTAGRNISGIII